MNAQQLKNSILQEAIEGRLVPQDPNDEPASVLLDKIRKEKARLVKEGKLKKKDLEEIPISEDEKLFEIPESWKWVRIDQIATSQLGKTLDKGKQTGKEYPYLCSINVYWDGIDLSKVKTFLLKDEELDKYKLKKGDLLVCEGGDYGRCNVWDSDEDMYYQNALHRIRFYGDLSVYFFKYIFEQYRTIDYIVGQGQTIKHFTYANMKTLAFPLPPLAEQKRIVAKIEELLPKVEEYGKAQEALDKLNEELPERLKKSILQEAIEGRLVPQDPNDEPASVLLDKIRKEKARLVKEGKLKKKDLEETPIYEDEIPFKIPESWEWTRIGNIYKTTSGGTPEKGHPEYYDGNIPWVKVGDLTNLYIDQTEDKITQEGLDHSSAKIFPKDTILLAMYCNDAIGKSSIITIPMTTNQAICGLYPNSYLVKEYVYFAIQSNRKKLQELSAGGAQKNINQKIVNNLMIPVPPLAEQKRIVAKIEQLMKEINKLKV